MGKKATKFNKEDWKFLQKGLLIVIFASLVVSMIILNFSPKPDRGIASVLFYMSAQIWGLVWIIIELKK